VKLEGLLRDVIVDVAADIVESSSRDTITRATLSFPEEKQKIVFWIDRERNTALYCTFFATTTSPFEELLRVLIYRHEDLNKPLGSMKNYLAEDDLKKFLATFVKEKLKGKSYQEVCGMLTSMQDLYGEAQGPQSEEAAQLAKFVRQMIGKA